MTIDPELLRRSFALVVERAPDLTHRFYETLFAKYPSTRSMFPRGSRARQEEMLARALTAVIEHLEQPTWLGPYLAALGAKHVEYGVRPEMYDWVGDALLTTLASVAGNEWMPELDWQWSEAYATIVALMRAGEPVEELDAVPISCLEEEASTSRVRPAPRS